MKWAKQTGFTIVELLIVIVVIAILAAITIVAYTGISDRAKQSAAASEIQQAAKSLEANKVLNNATYALDWTAARAAGVKVGDDTTVQYYSNGTSYCLDTVKAGVEYTVTSRNTIPQLDQLCSPEGVVSWLSLNGNANDYVNPAANVVVEDVSLTEGEDGKGAGAYYFDSRQDRIYTTAQYPTANGQAFTISVWAKGEPLDGDTWAYIARRGSGSGVGAALWIIAIYSNEYVMAVDGRWGNGYTGVAPSVNSWDNLVLTYDGSTQEGFINGTKRFSSNIGAIGNTFSGSEVLGRVDSSRVFEGSIDDYRVYDRVLTDAEIQSLYAVGAR